MGAGSSCASSLPLGIGIDDPGIVLCLQPHQSQTVQLQLASRTTQRLRRALDDGHHAYVSVKLTVGKGVVRSCAIDIHQPHTERWTVRQPPSTVIHVNNPKSVEEFDTAPSHPSKETSRSRPPVKARHRAIQTELSPIIELSLLSHDCGMFAETIFPLTVTNSEEQLIVTIEATTIIVQPQSLLADLAALSESHGQLQSQLTVARDRIDALESEFVTHKNVNAMQRTQRKERFVTAQERKLLVRHFAEWRNHVAQRSGQRKIIEQERTKMREKTLLGRVWTAWRMSVRLGKEEKWREVAKAEKMKRAKQMVLATMMKSLSSYFLRWKIFVSDRRQRKAAVLANMSSKRELSRQFKVWQHWRNCVERRRSERERDSERASMMDEQHSRYQQANQQYEEKYKSQQTLLDSLHQQLTDHQSKHQSLAADYETKAKTLQQRLQEEKLKRANILIQTLTMGCVSTAFVAWKRAAAAQKSERERVAAEAAKAASAGMVAATAAATSESTATTGFLAALVDHVPQSSAALSPRATRALLRKVFLAWKQCRSNRQRAMRSAVKLMLANREFVEKSNALRVWLYHAQQHRLDQCGAGTSARSGLSRTVSVLPFTSPNNDSTFIKLQAEHRSLQRLYDGLFRLIVSFRSAIINYLNEEETKRANSNHACRCEICSMRKRARLIDGVELAWMKHFDQQIQHFRFVK